MHLNPYGRGPVQLAADLANDRPAGLDELRRRCAEAGVTMDVPVLDGDLPVTLALLEEWEQVVDAATPAERAERLNLMLAEHSEHPRLTDHAGDGWHVHFRADRSLGGLLAALITVGTALHLAHRQLEGLGRCEGGGCTRIYADVSRNGTQRYCSTRCGSRAAVRRHRSRTAVA